MKNLPLLIITLVGTIALIVGVAVVFSSQSNPQARTVDPVAVVGEARHVKGPDEAKVTVVEFSDFQCPACKAVEPLVSQLAETYPNDVRVVYRHFPLNTIHPNAQMAAQAAVAAGEQGKFWEMHDLLFEKQSEWEAANSPQAARDIFITYAEQLAIDKQAFTEKIESDSVRDIVNKDLSYGTQIGVNATPTIFVNGTQTAPDQLLPAVAELLQ